MSNSQYVGHEVIVSGSDKRARKRLGWRRIGGTIAVVTSSAAVLLGAAGSAQAFFPRPPVADGTVIASPNVNVRPGARTLGPDMSRIIAQIPYDTQVSIDCVRTGPTVTGPFGTTSLWDRVVGYQGNDPAAWVSDAWINTGRSDISVDNSQC